MTSPLTLVFSYPRRGLSGDFCTFRLGVREAQFYTEGAEVHLCAAGSFKLLAHATVVSVHTGTLTDMAKLHAHSAHNWKEHPLDERPALLMASLKKRYPPGRVREDSPVTVIYLKELI